VARDLPESKFTQVSATGPNLTAVSRTVTLVDAYGAPQGELEVVAAHTDPGKLHLACSAVVFGPDETVLMQRRADHKPTFGGLWSNTCCTHPLAAEGTVAAAERRIFEELGIRVALTPAGSFQYRAVDPISLLVEHELDHISIGFGDPDALSFALNHDEVAEVAWVPLSQLHTLPLTPWCDMVMRIAISAHQSAATDHSGAA
jgi:isopentenyl-diphosphate Delta-isomerase